MKVGGLLLMLLIGIGLYLFLAADNAKTVTTAAKPSRQAAEEISGQGMRESYTLENVESNGKITAFKLKTLDPNGPLARIYDLQVGDDIIEIGPFSVRSDDPGTLRALLEESGSRQQKIVVLRNGQKVELEPHGDVQKLLNGARGTPSPAANPTTPGVPTIPGAKVGSH